MIVSLATTGTIFTLNIHKKGDGDYPVPKIIQIIFFGWISTVLFIRIKTDRTLTKSLDEKIADLLLEESRPNDNLELVVNNNHENILKDLIDQSIKLSYSDININIDINEDLLSSDKINSDPDMKKVIDKLNKTLNRSVMKEQIEVYKAEIKSQWSHLANVVDILFFYVFIILTFLMLFLIGINVPELRFY